MGEMDVKVGIGDLNLVSSPIKIMTIGLGSCVGISLFDKRKKIVGLSHIMLPDSTQFKEVKNPFKFADLAIPILIKKMEQIGCTRRDITAKIVGGASMFKFSDKRIISDIGERNVEMVKDILLNVERIPIVAQETGGSKGRTIIVNPDDGLVTVRTIGEEIMII